MKQRTVDGLNPGRKSSKVLQDCTICVFCRWTGPCRESGKNGLEWRDSRARPASSPKVPEADLSPLVPGSHGVWAAVRRAGAPRRGSPGVVRLRYVAIGHRQPNSAPGPVGGIRGPSLWSP